MDMTFWLGTFIALPVLGLFISLCLVRHPLSPVHPKLRHL
ncbi:hypothetical protein SAMN05421770_105184 [Granulicella rosea]|uniref:Uncharacterized protein n=1 Tax=Granulicella rosea TaxID=474952 RepID=A0A239KTX7_9BACT|nr:hypothetical protein SAMN05421770_105184 [Granulicella rosea]